MTGNFLVFNPLLNPTSHLIKLTLKKQISLKQKNVIYYSSNNLPVAYNISTNLPELDKYLTLLSCSNFDIDRQLLELLYDSMFELVKIEFPCSTKISNGFLPSKYWQPMEWCATHAIHLIRKLNSSPHQETNQEEKIKKIKLTSFFGHHAGDVLFMSIAASKCKSEIFDEIIIHESYIDITKKFNLEIKTKSISGPIPNRGTYKKEDDEYFLDIANQLPEDAFYVYCRTSRNYNFTDFHFIDHFRFTLGESLTTSQDLNLPIRTPPLPSTSRKRVLLHCGAGWPLKIYPTELQSDLIKILNKKNIEVITLDASRPFQGIKNEKFSTIENFEETVNNVDIVIGMDSFPAHYASAVLKKMTVYLFSSTHPANSSYLIPGLISTTSNGRDCCPCMGHDRCRKYGGYLCKNFASPDVIAREVTNLLEAGEEIKNQPTSPLPSIRCPKHFNIHNSKTLDITPNALSDLDRARAVMLCWSYARTLITLFNEFIHTTNNQGIRSALNLTYSFLKRNFAN